MFAAQFAPDPANDLAQEDPRVASGEARLAMLRELAALGMALARDIARRALEAPETPAAPEAAEAPDPAPAARSGSDPEPKPAADPKPASGARREPRHEPGAAFARVARAVRLTLALEASVEDAIAARRAGETDDESDFPPSAANAGGFPGAVQPYEALPRDYPSAHRNRIRDSVFEVINREISDILPAQETLDKLYERLIEGERYDALINRPFRETVMAICEDLGLNPDWSLWTETGWPPRSDGRRCVWHQFWGPRRRPAQPEPPRRPAPP